MFFFQAKLAHYLYAESWKRVEAVEVERAAPVPYLYAYAYSWEAECSHCQNNDVGYRFCRRFSSHSRTIRDPTEV
jgi:hypothetical protein